jgi:hypothetical protein
MPRNTRLTPKQERFVAEYLQDLNATAAAERAGYDQKNGNVLGPRLLRIPAVSAAIAAHKAARAKRLSTKSFECRLLTCSGAPRNGSPDANAGRFGCMVWTDIRPCESCINRPSACSPNGCEAPLAAL